MWGWPTSALISVNLLFPSYCSPTFNGLRFIYCENFTCTVFYCVFDVLPPVRGETRETHHSWRDQGGRASEFSLVDHPFIVLGTEFQQTGDGERERGEALGKFLNE